MSEQDVVERLEEAFEDAKYVEIRTGYETELLALLREAKRALEAQRKENEHLREIIDAAALEEQEVVMIENAIEQVYEHERMARRTLTTDTEGVVHALLAVSHALLAATMAIRERRGDTEEVLHEQ